MTTLDVYAGRLAFESLDDIYQTLTEETMLTESKSTGSSTEYIFTGSNMEVKAAIDDTMARFDPRGYGTRVVRIDILGPDELRAVVTRWNSCD